MFWCDQLVEKLEGPQTINDSKTPSGRAHVGALRGPLIHDAIYRTLKAKGVPVRYLFGVDDYDPVDEIPYGQSEHFEKYLSAPLCNTPPPPGSKATDMAEHFISEFFSVFAQLGVQPEFYRMRDIYRAGKFNGQLTRFFARPTSFAASTRRSAERSVRTPGIRFRSSAKSAAALARRKSPLTMARKSLTSAGPIS